MTFGQSYLVLHVTVWVGVLRLHHKLGKDKISMFKVYMYIYV